MADTAFSSLIQARCQPSFAALVELAAQRRGMTASEWVRQAARTSLQLEGIDPTYNAALEGEDAPEASEGVA